MSRLKKDLIKFKPREEQQRVDDYIFKLKSENPDLKFFLLNLPTGVGKSHLAMMIANSYINKIDKDAKVDIITAGKILQDQYNDTYESISNLKGKENYKCSQYECSCAQGAEFNRLNKTSCDFCPYDSAKQSYILGQVSLTNFYLYLIYAIYSQKILESRGSKVLIVDEAHEFDDVMSDFISIKITETSIKRLKFTNEYDIIKKLSNVKDIESYIIYLRYLSGEIIETIAAIENSMGINRNATADKRDLKISKITGSPNDDLKTMQIISDLKQYQIKIDVFLKDYEENKENWVLEKSFNEKTKQFEYSLEPIWAHDYLNKYVWSKYDMIILMSGTILNKKIFCDLNGIDIAKSAYYSMPSPFDVKNRPIYYMPVGKMSFTKKEETFKKYVPMIEKILNKYKGKKGIIHTNSFELSEWIKKDISNSRLMFHTSEDKNEALQNHFDSNDDSVIVSPSMSTGVSFDHDKSRFQIIAKIPYPSLASQKNKLRQKNNPDWYSWKTIAELLQMAGRSIRSKTDHADTIIIDGSFSDVLKYSSHFIPNWVQESIKKIEVKTHS